MYQSLMDFNMKKTDIIVHYATGPKTLFHNHTHFELGYVVKGSAIHRVADKEIAINEGDYYIIDLNTPHQYENLDDEPVHIINCIFRAKLIDDSLSLCKSFNEMISSYLIRFNRFKFLEVPTENVFHDHDGKILSIIKAIDYEVENKNIGHYELERCYLIELLITIMRNIYDTETANYSGVIAEVTDYVDKNFSSDISLEAISEKFNYSVSYISRKFKAETGEGFNAYLQRKRIEKACSLLANSTVPISAIVCKIGFNDYKHFLRVFRKHANISPQEFRKIHSKGMQ